MPDIFQCQIQLLVLLPFAAGIALRFISSASIRKFLVFATVIITIANAVCLIPVKINEIDIGDWGPIITILDFALLIFMFYVGIIRRSFLGLSTGSSRPELPF